MKKLWFLIFFSGCASSTNQNTQRPQPVVMFADKSAKEASADEAYREQQLNSPKGKAIKVLGKFLTFVSWITPPARREIPK
jgi:hypothetical protein